MRGSLFVRMDIGCEKKFFMYSICVHVSFSSVSMVSPIYAPFHAKGRSTNTHRFYTICAILPFNAVTPQRRAMQECPVTLHERPPLRLLLRPNITSVPVWRSIIPTMPTIIATIISVSRRKTRVATIPIIIPGRWVVLSRTVAVSGGARGVVST